MVKFNKVHFTISGNQQQKNLQIKIEKASEMQQPSCKSK